MLLHLVFPVHLHKAITLTALCFQKPGDKTAWEFVFAYLHIISPETVQLADTKQGQRMVFIHISQLVFSTWVFKKKYACSNVKAKHFFLLVLSTES